MEISALTECELKRFPGAFRAGAPSPLACLHRAHPFSLSPTSSKRLLRRLARPSITKHTNELITFTDKTTAMIIISIQAQITSGNQYPPTTPAICAPSPPPPPQPKIRQAAKKAHQESSILQSQAYPLERCNIKQEHIKSINQSIPLFRCQTNIAVEEPVIWFE